MGSGPDLLPGMVYCIGAPLSEKRVLRRPDVCPYEGGIFHVPRLFKETLNKHFHKKALTGNVTAKDVSLVKEANFDNVNKLAFQYSDGIILNTPDISPDLKSFAAKTGKPILEYPNKEEYIDAYSDFFDQILDTSK